MLKEVQAKLNDSLARVSELESERKGHFGEIKVLTEQKKGFELKVEVVDGHVNTLLVEMEALQKKVRELEVTRDAENRKTAKAAKKEMLNVFESILIIIKDKFEKKEALPAAKVKVQKVQSNVDLLNDIFTNEVSDLRKEYDHMVKVELPVRVQTLQGAAVYDLSIGKLELPQISDDSVGLVEVDPLTVVLPDDQPGQGESTSVAGGPKAITRKVLDELKTQETPDQVGETPTIEA